MGSSTDEFGAAVKFGSIALSLSLLHTSDTTRPEERRPSMRSPISACEIATREARWVSTRL